MGDQKDHMVVHKKETESAVIEQETTSLETATESLPPPTLQLKAEAPAKEENKEENKEEGTGKEIGEVGAFQFSLAAPPSEPDGNNSKTFDSETVQKKGVAELFSPIIHALIVIPFPPDPLYVPFFTSDVL